MESRGNLYQTLIFAAQDCLEQNGALPDDMAEFARMADVSPEDLHSIFATPKALQEGLIYHAVTLLNDAVRAGGTSEASGNDPIAQLYAIADGYLGWADANPALFRLVVTTLNEPLEHDGTLYRYAASMRDLFRRKFLEAQRLGILSPDTDIETSTMMLHCLVRGGNMMFVTGSTDPWFANSDSNASTMARKIFDVFMQNFFCASRKPAKTPA